MGDRFYEQQAGSKRAQAKPKRKLKSDIIDDIQVHIGARLPNLIKTDKETLEKLYEAIIVMRH